MPLTATTIAKRHSGEWELLRGPDVPFMDQHTEFRHRLGKDDPEFEVIRFQPEDDQAQVHRSRSPEQVRAIETQRKAEADAHKARELAAAKAQAEAAKVASDKAAAEHKKLLDEKDKIVAPTRGPSKPVNK